MMKPGQTLIEVMLGMALAALLMPALITAYFTARSDQGREPVRQLALARLRETQEILSVIKTADWSAVADNGTFHPELVDGQWVLNPGEEVLGGVLTRSLQLSDAYRDGAGNLAESGTLDPSTRSVSIRVSWESFIPASVTSDSYLMRLENRSFTETTAEDFLTGTNDSTTVTNEDGGEVTLGAGGSGNWCEPALTLTEFDLPKSGVANAISAVEGQILAGTGENASGVSMDNILVSNAEPPTAVSGGTFDGYKTNAVFTNGTFAYLATDTNSKEVEIVNLSSISDSKYQEGGYYNAPGNGNASGIFASGSHGFATIGSNLYVFDNTGLPNTSSSRPTRASISLSGAGGRLTVSGNYIYVTISSGTNALEIIEYAVDGSGNVTLNPRGSVVLGGGQTGRDVVLNSTATRAFLAASNHASQPEFYIIDLASKEGVRPSLGSYDTGSMQPKSLAAVSAGKVLLVGQNGEEYQVVSVSDNQSGSVNIARCGGLQIDSGAIGVSALVEGDGDAYAYLVTGDANAELKIIEGGPGGQLASSGTYLSSPFDATASAVFNRFQFTHTAPAQTSLSFQIAVADAVNDACTDSDYQYLGPDGTGNTFFTEAAPIPLGNIGSYRNPARCFRYKLYLGTNDGTVAPVLHDITVNYSP